MTTTNICEYLNNLTQNQKSHQQGQIIDIPLKYKKELEKIAKLEAEKQKIINELSTKMPELKTFQSEKILNPQKTSETPYSQSRATKNSFVNLQAPTLSMSQYIISCILKILGFRQLSIKDISFIFGIQANLIEQIYKTHRYKKLSNYQINPIYLENNIIKPLKKFFNQSNFNSINTQSIQASLNREKSFQSQQNFMNPCILDTKVTALAKLKKSASSPYLVYSAQNGSLMASDSERFSAMQPKKFSQQNFWIEGNQIFQYWQNCMQKQENDKLPSYEMLAKRKPPHRLDRTAIALVQILKNKPNLLQKDMIKVLQEEYKIFGLNQTAISRKIRKIYQMQRLCNYITQEKKKTLKGFVHGC